MVDLKGSTANAALDEAVPFFQMVFHGLVGYSAAPLNEADDYTSALLESVATGAALYYKVFAADADVVRDTQQETLYSHSLTQWQDKIKEAAAWAGETLSRVAAMPITAYDMVSEGVSRTVFGDAVTVYVNRTESDIVIEGCTVPARSFSVKEAAV